MSLDAEQIEQCCSRDGRRLLAWRRAAATTPRLPVALDRPRVSPGSSDLVAAGPLARP